ncbi:SAM-dependent methyltransferase [Actinomarinicola tropica]|uniref:Methyltransferase domain-containing protein n=1 Tax=Actinomarinicola tropica TaxID=2789776 RepID=A0A5Q2RJG2_9ACTN|nr:cyclopropane-fatty-acyl-phospholipid synthase family protein [Actinomarinicola tropica]QGG95943.1 methyltransferase domain-containing protein [Actinomarinicola tropica]
MTALEIPTDGALPEPDPPLSIIPEQPTGRGRVAPERLLAHARRHSVVPRIGAAAARAAVLRLLHLVEGGEVVVVDGDDRRTVSSTSDDRYGRAHLRAVVTVHDPRFYAAVVRGGSSGLGEAYRQGWFDVDDLTALLRLLARAMRRVEPIRQRAHRLARPVAEPIRRRRRPDPQRDRDNIAAHYDLGNDFFELFLDPTLTYSAGIFERPDASLAEASIAKIERLCQALDLQPGQRVVEIGTGWGAFAIHAARHHGVEVVTTTLSAEQHAVATARVRAAGLEDRIEVRLDHYRDLHGRFDALVAVEMIEAVDWRELGDFVEHCARLVGPDGAVAYQAIVAAPARWSRARVTEDFIKSHVFPGGNLPSVPSILDAATARTDLSLVDLADFGMDYAETLRRWGATLADRRADAQALGLDDAFLRLWDFYLRYCEAGFEERQVSVVQMVLERPGRARSLLGQA